MKHAFSKFLQLRRQLILALGLIVIAVPAFPAALGPAGPGGPWILALRFAARSFPTVFTFVAVLELAGLVSSARILIRFGGSGGHWVRSQSRGPVLVEEAILNLLRFPLHFCVQLIAGHVSRAKLTAVVEPYLQRLAALQPKDVHSRLKLSIHVNWYCLARVVCEHPLGPGFDEGTVVATARSPSYVYGGRDHFVLTPCNL